MINLITGSVYDNEENVVHKSVAWKNAVSEVLKADKFPEKGFYSTEQGKGKTYY